MELRTLEWGLRLKLGRRNVTASAAQPAVPPARDVMVAGRWVIRDGLHAAEAQIDARYRATLRRLEEPLRQALIGDSPIARAKAQIPAKRAPGKE